MSEQIYNSVIKDYSEKVQLFHNDCLLLLKNFQDSSIDLIVTDPPYPVTKRGCAGNTGGMMKTKITMQGKIFTHNDIDCAKAVQVIYFLFQTIRQRELMARIYMTQKSL